MKNILLIIILLLAGFLHAASFDCAKATTKLEKGICSLEGLGLADEDMAQRYNKIKKLLTDQGQESLQASQRNWLKKRNTLWRNTDDFEAVYELYQARILYFDSVLEYWEKTELKPSSQIASKKEKFLKAIEVIKTTENLALKRVVKVPGYWNKQQCEKAFENLIEGKNVRLIEPEVYASSIYNPTIQVQLNFPSKEELAETLIGNGTLTYYPSGDLELYYGDPIFQGYQYLYVSELFLPTGHGRSRQGLYYQFDQNVDRNLSISFGSGSGYSGLINEEYFNPTFLVEVHNEIAVLSLDYTLKKNLVTLTFTTLLEDLSMSSSSTCKFRNFQ